MKNIDGRMLALIIESASNNLQNNAGMINDLNVFPVPDGDTGTNMSLTFSAAAEAALDCDNASCSDMSQALARASLRGARGNSGVILSQILRGAAAGLSGQNMDVDAVKSAVIEAKNSAYRAIMKPTEGTILTVIREMSEFAELKADEYADVSDFCVALLEAAKASLENTPNLLPALKEAGVVDAGGMGVVVLLEGAVYALINGEVLPLNMETASKIIERKKLRPIKEDSADIKFIYCTEFLINKQDAERSSAQFMAAIKPKGDCMLVIDDDEIIKVHIHTNHPGFVIEQALRLGELTNLKIDNMRYQHDEKIITEDRKKDLPKTQADKKPSKKIAFVAVATGDGVAETFRSAGADIVLEGGQTMNPSTQSILDAVCEADAEIVIVLPNNKNIILAAQQVDDISEANIVVIPTRNIAQGISALLAFDADESAEQNIKNITEAIGQVRCGQVTLAARDSVVDGMEIKKGAALGLENDDIIVVCDNIDEAAAKLAESMISEESAIVTVYYGESADEKCALELSNKIEEKHTDLDVSVIYGGQSVYSYIIAVE